MSTFFRNTVGIVLVVGLSFVVGCSTAQSGSKQTNVFSFPKATPKQEEKATPKSMQEFIGMERVPR